MHVPIRFTVTWEMLLGEESPVTWEPAAAFRSANKNKVSVIPVDSRIQRSVVLSDAPMQTSFGTYRLAFFYLWTYKQRESVSLWEKHVRKSRIETHEEKIQTSASLHSLQDGFSRGGG